MATFFRLLLGYVWDCFRSHERLKAEILILRHQLNILHRKAPKRLRLSGGDRALFVWLYRRFPDIGNAVAIIRPETVIRWHRMGFRAWWRWRCYNPGGRPGIDQEARDLVRRMCKENPLWGARRRRTSPSLRADIVFGRDRCSFARLRIELHPELSTFWYEPDLSGLDRAGSDDVLQ